MNIGDLVFGFRGDGKLLQSDAQAAGLKAGETAGKSFSGTFQDRIGKMKADFAKGGGIPGALLGGVGIGAGFAAFGAITAGIGTVVGALGSVLQAAIDDEASISRLGQSLKANVDDWDGNTTAIEDNIKAKQRLGFDDESLRDSLAVLVGATHDVTKAQEIQNTAMDLARFKRIDLKTATEALIKVEGGAYRSLKQLGIKLKDNATSAEALAAVQAVAAGQAEAYADTTAGAMEALQISIDETVEDIGKSLLPAFKLLIDAAATLVDSLGLVTDGFTQMNVLGAERMTDLQRTILATLASGGEWLAMQDRLADAMGLTHEALNAEIEVRMNNNKSMDQGTVIAQIYAEFLRNGFVPAVAAATYGVSEMSDSLTNVPRVTKVATDAMKDFEAIATVTMEKVKNKSGKGWRWAEDVSTRLHTLKVQFRDDLHTINWLLAHPGGATKTRNELVHELTKMESKRKQALDAKNWQAFAKADEKVNTLRADIAKLDGQKATVTLQMDIARNGFYIPGFGRVGAPVATRDKTKRHVPPRAMGGPVRRGMPYVVGENRPELFVPDQNGTIVPEVGGSSRVDFYVHDPDGGLARAGISTAGLARELRNHAGRRFED